MYGGKNIKFNVERSELFIIKLSLRNSLFFGSTFYNMI